MNEPGNNTADLRAHRTPPAVVNTEADDLEKRTQLAGRRMLAAGIIGMPMPFLSCLVAALITNSGWGNAEARLFGILGMFVLALGFSSLLFMGAAEHRERPVRARQRENAVVLAAQQRETAAAVERLRIQVLRLTLDMEERDEVKLGLLSPIPGRISATEEELHALVAVLPEHVQRQYWAGFNDAVREGFQATGTDGSGKRRTHLGLVHPDESGTEPTEA